MNSTADFKRLLKQSGLRPNKLLGQHFLIDRRVLQKIIAAANLTKNDLVLEVGPGLGILTEELAKQAGRVIAVEKDKKLAKILKERFKEEKNVEIVEGDILQKFNTSIVPAPNLSFPRKRESSPGLTPTGIQTLSLQKQGTTGFRVKPGMTIGSGTNYKVVANIPYYLTSRLIRKFLESESLPQEMVLMLQKEVAQRICAKPPRLRQACLPARQGYGGQAKMSLLSVSVQFYAQPKIIDFISKKSFWPQPKVDSAIIKIIPFVCLPLCERGIEGDLKTDPKILPNLPFSKEGIKHFFRVVRAGFAQPRKQLINNLSKGLNIDRQKIAQALKKIGLEPEQRAEALNVQDWVKLIESMGNFDHGQSEK